MPPLRVASFNLENLDDETNIRPPLADRIRVMRPQLVRMRADILCLQEMHSQRQGGQRTLTALDDLLAGTEYSNFHRAVTETVSGEFYHERNLVVLSRFPIPNANVDLIRDGDGPRPSYQMATARPPDTTANLVEWERPILYVQIPLGNGSTIHVANLHLKSKIPSNIPGQKINNFTWRSISAWAEGSFVSTMKRVGQALQMRMLVDSIFDAHGEDALIAVCGDFNAESDDIPLQAICGSVEETGNPDHGPRILTPCENNVAESSRYSLWHLGQGQMFDHVLASRQLLSFFRGAEIHNETLPDESGAFRTDIKFPESDHAPVIAEFEIP